VTRALLLSILLTLSGCSCWTYRVVDLDVRAKFDERRRFVVLATRLAEGDAFSDLPAAALALESRYRQRALPGQAPWGVQRIADAPEPLRACLLAAREELLDAGYEAATAAEGPGAPDLIVLVGLTTTTTGELTRVAVDVGGPVDDEFERVLVSIDAKIDEGCEVVAEDLVRKMVGALPGPGDEKDAEKLEREAR